MKLTKRIYKAIVGGLLGFTVVVSSNALAQESTWETKTSRPMATSGSSAGVITERRAGIQPSDHGDRVYAGLTGVVIEEVEGARRHASRDQTQLLGGQADDRDFQVAKFAVFQFFSPIG